LSLFICDISIQKTSFVVVVHSTLDPMVSPLTPRWRCGCGGGLSEG